MKIETSKRGLKIILAQEEAEFLIGVLDALAKDYAVPPAEQDAAACDVWYSAEGCRSSGMTPAERAEWLGGLHEFRGENRRRLEAWAKKLRRGKFPMRWQLGFANAEVLLMGINDYRLGLAGRHDVAQHEMEHDLVRVKDPVKRQALHEIHVLGWMMEMMIQGMGRMS